MRLNIDCVRDIMLCVEENTTFRKGCLFVDTELAKSLPCSDSSLKEQDYQIQLVQKYSLDTLLYHVRYCVDSYLLLTSDFSDEVYTFITDLTPDGHSLLANIRENNNWNKIKNIAGQVGSTSLSALTSIASGVISELIKQQLNLL